MYIALPIGAYCHHSSPSKETLSGTETRHDHISVKTRGQVKEMFKDIVREFGEKYEADIIEDVNYPAIIFGVRTEFVYSKMRIHYGFFVDLAMTNTEEILREIAKQLIDDIEKLEDRDAK